VHTHSPYATAWGCLPPAPLVELEELVYLHIGQVSTVTHHHGGSPELAAAAGDCLGSSAAVLLERHGVVTVGETPSAALQVAEAVEHVARVSWLARD
jgi:ribulose-5-phosphate 4-epimerase/fuculose-1-phosphate aldolase